MDIETKPTKVDRHVLSATVPGAAERVLTGDEIERLAKGKQDRWMQQEAGAGRRFGTPRDDTAKLHPTMVPWADLSGPPANSTGCRSGRSPSCFEWSGGASSLPPNPGLSAGRETPGPWTRKVGDMSVLLEMIAYFESRGMLDEADLGLVGHLGLRQQFIEPDDHFDYEGWLWRDYEFELWEQRDAELAELSSEGAAHDEDRSVLGLTGGRRTVTGRAARGASARRLAGRRPRIDVTVFAQAVDRGLVAMEPHVAPYLAPIARRLGATGAPGAPGAAGGLRDWVEAVAGARPERLQAVHREVRHKLDQTIGAAATLTAMEAFWRADPCAEAFDVAAFSPRDRTQLMWLLRSGPQSARYTWCWRHRSVVTAHLVVRAQDNWGRTPGGRSIDPTPDPRTEGTT